MAGGGYPYLTVNAYNAWAVVPGDLGHSLANAGLWVCDVVTPRPGAVWQRDGRLRGDSRPSSSARSCSSRPSSRSCGWSPGTRTGRRSSSGLSVLALAFFAVPTRVHERYGFPFFALGAILFAVSRRWRIAYVVLPVATFANMYVVLTTLYPPSDPATNPVRDWLGIGESLRSQIGVTTAAHRAHGRLRLGVPPAARRAPGPGWRTRSPRPASRYDPPRAVSAPVLRGDRRARPVAPGGAAALPAGATTAARCRRPADLVRPATVQRGRHHRLVP